MFCLTNVFGSGSMEFVVPLADSSAFFPISVRFVATDTFSDLKVCLYLTSFKMIQLKPTLIDPNIYLAELKLTLF